MAIEKTDRQKVWVSRFSWILWIAVIFLLAQVMGKGSTVITVTIEEDGLSIASEEGNGFRLKWEEVQSLELRDEWDYGTLVEGTDNGKEKSGIWENAETGEYELFVSDKIQSVIYCTLDEGEPLVFNYESEKTTASLYDAMLEKMAEYE